MLVFMSMARDWKWGIRDQTKFLIYKVGRVADIWHQSCSMTQNSPTFDVYFTIEL